MVFIFGVNFKFTQLNWQVRVLSAQKIYSATCLCSSLCRHLCPDRSVGLVLRGQGVSEEQLEPSGRDAGDDFCHRHPGLPHLQLGHQDPGYAQSAEAAEDPAAAAVSGSTRIIYRLRRQTTPVKIFIIS